MARGGLRPLCGSLVLAMLVLPGAALAQAGPYVGISGAKVFEEDMEGRGRTGVRFETEFGDEWAVAAAAGYRFGIPVRVEGEFTWVTAEVDGGNTDARGRHHDYLFMVNAYYDHKLAERWTVFAGGGLGAAHTDSSVSFVNPRTGTRESRDVSGTHFAYQVKAGVAYSLTERADLTLGYRYVRTEERELSAELEEAALHFVEIGVRFRFGR